MCLLGFFELSVGFDERNVFFSFLPACQALKVFSSRAASRHTLLNFPFHTFGLKINNWTRLKKKNPGSFYQLISAALMFAVDCTVFLNLSSLHKGSRLLSVPSALAVIVYLHRWQLHKFRWIYFLGESLHSDLSRQPCLRVLWVSHFWELKLKGRYRRFSGRLYKKTKKARLNSFVLPGASWF